MRQPQERNLASALSFGAVILVWAAQAASAPSNESFDAQREWSPREHADVVTGDLYPAALLMSKKPVDTSTSAAGVGHGYLAVGNYSKRPLEVTIGWDEPYARERTAKCKPSGCEMTAYLGSGNVLKLVALQDKHSPVLILQDGRAFVSATTRHVGDMKIEVQTVNYGTVTINFSTASRLQVEKLASSKKSK